MKRKCSILLGLLLLAAPAAVQAQYNCTTNSDTITLNNYTGSGGAVTIPSYITSVGQSAFQGCVGLTSITIPDSITSIGNNAFESCTGLKNVAIPEGVASIGDNAFLYCSGLTNVSIPGTVTNIGTNAFFYCNNLTAIAVDEGNVFYSSTNGVLFDQGQTTLLQFPGGLTGNYTIPGSVTNIGAAFNECWLTSVTIPCGVTSIGPNAFYRSLLLKKVLCTGNITSIGDNAFSTCIDLKSIYFTGNPPAADSTVFSAAPVTVYYLPGGTGWSSSFAGRPAVLWNPGISTSDANFGVQNSWIGFNITNKANLTVVVEACTNLANPVWVPLTTNTMVNGSFYFSEPVQTSGVGRFYGLGVP